MPAPERLLFVKPVLGNTYAAVAASADFSDWVQIPNRTAGASLPTPDAPPSLAGHSETYNNESADDPFVFDLPHVVAWRNFVASASRYSGAGEAGLVGGGAPGGLSFFHQGGQVSGTYPGDDDPFHYIDSHGVVWMPTVSFRAVNRVQSQWTDSWRPAYPPGAIGYEVEQAELDGGQWAALSEPVSAAVSFTLADQSTGGDYHGAITTVTLNDRFGAAQMTPSGADITASPDYNRANAEDAAHAVVQTPVGSPGSNPNLSASLVVSDFTSAPPRSGLFAVWQSVTIPGAFEGTPDSWPNTGTIRLISQMQGLSVTYTIRPPRIRWIYPASQAVTYRRTYPRDDSLGGGAARTWPPSKAVQSSNRTFGGYL